MTENVLGKIVSADFGMVSDYPFLFGLKLHFSLGDWGCIGDGGKYTVNISPECKYETRTREEAITAMVEKTHQILKDAKVDNVYNLIGKPVLVTIVDNCFCDFRILTEVL